MPTLGGVETSYKCGGPAKLLSQQWTSIPSVLQSVIRSVITGNQCAFIGCTVHVHVRCFICGARTEITNRERRKKRREENEQKPREPEAKTVDW